MGQNGGRVAVAADQAPRRRTAFDHEASSAIGTRARVARLSAEHPDQLGCSGVDLAQMSLSDISSTLAACASPQSIPPEDGATLAAHRSEAQFTGLVNVGAWARPSGLAPEHHSAGAALPGFPCF